MDSKNFRYGHLVTRESPRQILEEDFPGHSWPIEGGWGYTPETAVKIHAANEREGIGKEEEFVEFRTYEELIIFRPEGEKLAGIRVLKGNQYLVEIDGIPHDRVEYRVTAFTEEDFERLRGDWESHGCYAGDPEGMKRHLEDAAACRIGFDTECWFDISGFFGKI